MRRPQGRWLALVFMVAAAAAIVVHPLDVSGQTVTVSPETIAGKYEGSATTGSGDLAVKMDLRVEKNGLVGSIETAQGPVTVLGSTITGDRIVLNIDMNGAAGTITGTYKDGRVQGGWAIGEDSGDFWVAKVGAGPVTPAVAVAAASPAPKTPDPAASDPISGTWDGITGQGDFTRSFTLTLKLDGEKVSGEISSEDGGGPLSVGAWKDGGLTLSFSLGEMTITMIGALKEGKLVGTLDVSGQMQMPWGAVKRAAGTGQNR
jgi:hypothetical protein